MSRKKISIHSGTFNEEGNIEEFYRRVKAVISQHPEYDFEIIMADNCSKDNTRQLMRKIAAQDPLFKVIFNSNNFGATRSGMHNLLHEKIDSDAAVMMCSDLQDPPELLHDFIKKYEEGFDVVCAVKSKSKENPLIFAMRSLYYWLLKKVSDDELISGFTGFGLYDRKVIEAIRQYKDPNPYLRGMIAEIGFRRCCVEYTQEKRQNGRSSYNFFSYYDFAMNGFVNHSKLPLRMAVFGGFFIAMMSMLAALGYFIYKLFNWNSFQVGMAPLVIGLFFFSSIQLIFIGILGEYIGAIYTHVKNKPYVIEDELINFDDGETTKQTD